MVDDADKTFFGHRIVFNPDVSETLRALLDGEKTLESMTEEKEVKEVESSAPVVIKEEPKFKKSGFKSSFVPLAAASVPTEIQEEGQAVNKNGTVKEMTEDLDGEAMEDMDGEPIEDVDGEPLEDVDGEPIDEVDGEAMDEDLDGEAL